MSWNLVGNVHITGKCAWRCWNWVCSVPPTGTWLFEKSTVISHGIPGYSASSLFLGVSSQWFPQLCLPWWGRWNAAGVDFLCVAVVLIIRHAWSGSFVSHSWVLLFPQDKVDAGLPTAIVSTLTIFKDCKFSFHASLLKQYLRQLINASSLTFQVWGVGGAAWKLPGGRVQPSFTAQLPLCWASPTPSLFDTFTRAS